MAALTAAPVAAPADPAVSLNDPLPDVGNMVDHAEVMITKPSIKVAMIRLTAA